MAITYQDIRLKHGELKRNSSQGHTVQKLIDGEWIQICEECENPMPKYPEAPFGFVSPASNEMRLGDVMGNQGIEAIPKNVCKECYREDHKKVYPKEIPCQI